MAVLSAPAARSAEPTRQAHAPRHGAAIPVAAKTTAAPGRQATKTNRARQTHPKPYASGASAAAIAAVASETTVIDATYSATTSCGSMLMPAAALKTVSRGYSSYHPGIDLMAPYGSPIRAAAAGRVIFAGSYFGYGNMVDIQSNTGVVTRYGHLSAFARDTQPGHVYAVGETIGQVGTSGQAHGPHVHFEVRMAGRAVDPAPFLALASCPTGSGPAIEEAHAPDTGKIVTSDSRPGGVFQ